jgi:hypothetical protein
LQGVHRVDGCGEGGHVQTPGVGGLGSYGCGDGWLQAYVAMLA